MPQWSHEIPETSRAVCFALARAPKAGKLAVTILSTDLVGCPTHFFGGRTVPCEPPDCPACRDGVSWRWHGYVAICGDAGDGKPTKPSLLELTANACAQLKQLLDENASLRGIKIGLTRVGKRLNGRVQVTQLKSTIADADLPPEPEVVRALTTIWGLDRRPDTSETRTDGAKRITPRKTS